MPELARSLLLPETPLRMERDAARDLRSESRSLASLRYVVAIATAAALVASAGESRAVPITVPTTLSPGSEYRLAFVTSAIRNATSTDIADYNAFVDATAETIPELAALGQDWKAIASTATVDAVMNTSTNWLPVGPTGVPIFLLNDTKLADNYDDLWDGSIDASFNILETGVPAGAAYLVAWTGTLQSGFKFAGLGTANPLAGGLLNMNDGWVAGATIPNAIPYSLYAISGTLTVPIPEPGTAALLALGLIGLGVVGRRV